MPQPKQGTHKKLQLAVNTLRDMISNDPKLTTQLVLAQTVAFVTGKPYHSEQFRSAPGDYTNNPFLYSRKKKAHIWKKVGECIEELRKFAKKKNLIPLCFHFSQVRVLNAIIDYLKNELPTPAPLAPTQNHSFFIENILMNSNDVMK